MHAATAGRDCEIYLPEVIQFSGQPLWHERPRSKYFLDEKSIDLSPELLHWTLVGQLSMQYLPESVLQLLDTAN